MPLLPQTHVEVEVCEAVVLPQRRSEGGGIVCRQLELPQLHLLHCPRTKVGARSLYLPHLLHTPETTEDAATPDRVSCCGCQVLAGVSHSDQCVAQPTPSKEASRIVERRGVIYFHTAALKTPKLYPHCIHTLRLRSVRLRLCLSATPRTEIPKRPRPLHCVRGQHLSPCVST